MLTAILARFIVHNASAWWSDCLSYGSY